MPPQEGGAAIGQTFDYRLLAQHATYVADYLIDKSHRNGTLGSREVIDQVKKLMENGIAYVGPDNASKVNFKPLVGPNVFGDNQAWDWRIYRVNRETKRMEVVDYVVEP